jgi:hypothetical protein
MNTESNLSGLSIDDLIQTGKSGYLSNYEALEYLKEKRDFWYNLSKIWIAITSITAILSLGFASGGAAAALKCLAIAISFDRLTLIIEPLLEAFKNEITIIPKVKTESGKIELFVKTNDGRLFAFESRSKGTSQIKWRQEQQDFFISSRQKNGKTRTQKWSELSTIGANLNESVLALKRQKNQIVGTTNTQLKKPVIKAIIFTGKTEISQNNDDELFVDFGRIKKDDKKLLRVAAEYTIFLLNQDDLVNFLLPQDKNS